MPILRVELAPDELGVVLLEVATLGVLEQFVALVHLQAKRLDGAHHLAGVGDDGFFAVGQLGEVVALDVIEERQLDLLGVDQYKLQLTGVLFVEQ